MNDGVVFTVKSLQGAQDLVKETSSPLQWNENHTYTRELVERTWTSATSQLFTCICSIRGFSVLSQAPRHQPEDDEPRGRQHDATTRPTAGAEGREDEDVQHHWPFITGFAITGLIVTKMTTNFTEEDLKNSKFI
uniref:Uncharacterized protein n=1 Tax=Zea mays TaxID=4577 RepID=A0A804RFV9_MAIZE